MLHATVPLQSPVGDIVEIDVDIAEFISRVWCEGMRTFYSCQGYRPDEVPAPERNVQLFMRGYVVINPYDLHDVLKLMPVAWWPRKIEPPIILTGRDYYTQTVRFLRW